jgi:glycerophosphoryl diester phosphodiesterase
MALSRRDFAALAAAASVVPAGSRAQTRPVGIVALGGASLERPAGTAAAFDLAASQGADFIETGLAASQDGVLVARDDPELSASTDVAVRPEFAGRKTSKTIDGATIEGWFTTDFSVAELKTLTCTEPSTKARGRSASEAAPQILTFQEVIDIARAASAREARVIGVCASLRHPAWFAASDLALEPRVADLIRINGYNWPAAAMIVQSPDVDCLKTLGGLTRARRTWLLAEAAATPPDFVAARGWAEGVEAAALDLLDLSGPAATPTPLTASAHAAGLTVQARVDQRGDAFPPRPFRRGDVRAFLAATLAAGPDRLATRAPAEAVKARGRMALG